MRRRARALALSLLELGEDLEATEHQLHRWRFHPAVAFDATRWAAAIHAHRRAGGGTHDLGSSDPAGRQFVVVGLGIWLSVTARKQGQADVHALTGRRGLRSMWQ